MALDQIFNILREYFPATLGAVVGVWNKRKGTNYKDIKLRDLHITEKVFLFLLGLFGIILGVSISKWVSTALVSYYDLPTYIVPVIEFVTALSGIKIVDSTIKGIEKSLDVISDKLPKIVSSLLDVISNKIKKFFE